MVLVTTKKGSYNQKLSTTVNAYTGFSNSVKYLKLLTAPKLYMLKRERYTNDGELKGTTSTEESVNLSNTNKWTLGRNEEFPGERIFHGKIKQVKIFREALSAEEISLISKQ